MCQHILPANVHAPLIVDRARILREIAEEAETFLQELQTAGDKPPRERLCKYYYKSLLLTRKRREIQK